MFDRSTKNFLALLKFLCLALSLSIIISSYSFAAGEMESPGYRIQGGNVNIGGGEESSQSYNLSTSIGQLAAGEFQSQGYVVRAGFQYIHSIIPFQFSVSQTDVKLGNLIPNEPKTASTTLTVSFGSAGSYQVTTAQEGPLRTQTGAQIEDTNCDGGAHKCDEYNAKKWASNRAHGFGYNMSGQDTTADFVSEIYFRRFADLDQEEAPAVVMSNPNVGKSRKAKMTFKANIPPDQETGSYETIINFVATPGF